MAGEVGDGLRVHYLDEGPASAAPVLLLHGKPSWSTPPHEALASSRH